MSRRTGCVFTCLVVFWFVGFWTWDRYRPNSKGCRGFTAAALYTIASRTSCPPCPPHPHSPHPPPLTHPPTHPPTHSPTHPLTRPPLMGFPEIPPAVTRGSVGCLHPPPLPLSGCSSEHPFETPPRHALPRFAQMQPLKCRGSEPVLVGY